MRRQDLKTPADVAEALADEIYALKRLDPHDPQISLLQERLRATVHKLYQSAPRGV